MEIDGETCPSPAILAAMKRGRRTSSMFGEQVHVRFTLGAAEVREFGVETPRVEAKEDGTGREDKDSEDDSPRVYKFALGERIRKARRRTVLVNEERAFRRAERLRNTLETSDEKHLGFSSKRLEFLRKFFAAARAMSRTQSPDGEVDLSWEKDDVFVTDVAKGQAGAPLVPDVEAASPGWFGSADECEPSFENKKKSKLGVAWRSLSTSCTRAAQLTSKGFSNVRKKAWFRDTSSKDASHGGTQGFHFTRGPKRDNLRVHSLASIVPHQEA
eukprot:TRINITY_DN13204_c0_g1_i1.p1 TRINITY_DN13204_c0_g1~~TRINITY_DN13204_c0_g1_i1.p1  ORF type:complete len:299 (-),score=49.87 TRINITY_DN13204_c0_g1_i1:116-931(-)